MYIIKKDMDGTSWIPRVLVIGPGGFKALKVLGFLSPIEDKGLLKYVDTYCGVSAGAIISLLLVCGYEIREIVGEVATLDLFKDLDNLTIRSIVDNRGFISNEPIKKRLTNLILKKFGTIPTLYGLYMQTGKAYIAVSLNATDEKCEMMGPFTHPNVSCIDATLFSMNIPFVFYQLMYHGKTYVDGALANPYPVDYFDDGNTNILGIYMKTSNGKNLPSNRIIERIDDNSLGSHMQLPTYCYKIIHSLMDQRRFHIMQCSSDKCKHVCLETKFLDMVGYGITKEDKANLLVEGFNEGKSFLEKISNGTYQDAPCPPVQSYVYPPYYLNEFYDEPLQ